VVEIEAAQIILIGLPLAAVLRHDEAGHGFEHFAGTDDGAQFELLLTHIAL
jgi:hypothetical protein